MPVHCTVAPKDPFQGHNLRYRRYSTGLVLYRDTSDRPATLLPIRYHARTIATSVDGYPCMIRTSYPSITSSVTDVLHTWDVKARRVIGVTAHLSPHHRSNHVAATR